MNPPLLENLTIVQLTSFSSIVGVWGGGINLLTNEEVKFRNDSFELTNAIWKEEENGNKLPMILAIKDGEDYLPYYTTEKLPSMVMVKNIKGLFVLKTITRIHIDLLSFSLDGHSSFTKKKSYCFIAEYL